MGAQSKLNRDRRRLAAERHPTYVIAYIHPGQVSAYFATSLLQTVLREWMLEKTGQRPSRIANIIEDHSSANVSAARNTLTQRFLDQPAGEWLLWVDADMQWEADAVDRLLEVADPVHHPIVGGLAFGHTKDGMFPTVYHWLRTDEGGITTIRVRDYPRNTVTQVAATGAAFLLIHRSALERMAERRFDRAFPFFAESAGNGLPVGEDITFCVRAAMLDIPVHVHTGVRIGHHKSALLTEDEFLRQLPAGLPPSVGLVIPTRGDRPELLAGVIAASGLPPERVVVVDTCPADVAPLEVAGATVVVDRGPVNIHRWWNTGLDLLAGRGCRVGIVANDDLIISPDTLPRLWRGMGSATLALATAEGPSGHLFALDLGHGVRPDEAYRWYGGDLQLAVDATERGGGVVRVPESWHLHMHPTQDTEASPELAALAAADDELYDRRHPPGSPGEAIRGVSA